MRSNREIEVKYFVDNIGNIKLILDKNIQHQKTIYECEDYYLSNKTKTVRIRDDKDKLELTTKEQDTDTVIDRKEVNVELDKDATLHDIFTLFYMLEFGLDFIITKRHLYIYKNSEVVIAICWIDDINVHSVEIETLRRDLTLEEGESILNKYEDMLGLNPKDRQTESLQTIFERRTYA